MAVDTVKRNKRQYEWQKENSERINFTMKKGTKERIKHAAEVRGMKPSEFIRAAIEQELERTPLLEKNLKSDTKKEDQNKEKQ